MPNDSYINNVKEYLTFIFNELVKNINEYGRSLHIAAQKNYQVFDLLLFSLADTIVSFYWTIAVG